MSRNDQHTRQWLVLRALQSKPGKTLQDIASTLPRDFPKHLRTIRRDLDALEAAGYPIINERVDGRVRWRLMEGYGHVPALNFSPSESAALMMAQHLLKPLEGTPVEEALNSALAKTGLPVSDQGHGTIRELQSLFSFKLGSHKVYAEHRETIQHLTTAISKLRTVQIKYYSASQRRLNRREIEPYELLFTNGALYVVGYCRLRKDVRLFAVERIRALTFTDHPYQIPLEFDSQEYTQHALGVMQGKPVTVMLRFDPATAAWVRDRIWHPSQVLTPLKKGELEMTLTVAENRELVGWVLSFGSGVQVIAPDSLKHAVREEARKIVNLS